jgi:hypothetical protein
VISGSGVSEQRELLVTSEYFVPSMTPVGWSKVACSRIRSQYMTLGAYQDAAGEASGENRDKEVYGRRPRWDQSALPAQPRCMIWIRSSSVR